MKPTTLFLATAVLLCTPAARAGDVHVPNDFPTIQEAVDAALDGDTILVAPGVYRENVVVTSSGLTLKGKKATIDGAYLGTCLTVTADDVTITGFTLSNGGPGVAEGSEGGGLLYTGAGASITKCDARACVDFGIKLVGSGEVVDNEVEGSLGTGILVDTGDKDGPLTTLRDNQSTRNAAGIVAIAGPFLIERNTTYNNSGDGLSVSILGAGTPATLTEISRHKSQTNGGAGILVVDEAGAVMLIEKGDVNGNDVGMDVSSSAAAMLVSKNDVSFNRAGGAFLKVSGATVDDNVFRRNTLAGVVVEAAAGGTDGSNFLLGNRAEANGGDGIRLASSLNTVEHCSVKDNIGDGIMVLTGADSNAVLDNIVKGNEHDGIDNWGTNTLISDNSTKGNGGADLAGVGDGGGTVDPASIDNVVGDGTALDSPQELELDTLAP